MINVAGLAVMIASSLAADNGVRPSLAPVAQECINRRRG
jgi:hypothetical protein